MLPGPARRAIRVATGHPSAALAAEMLELPQVRAPVEEIERLRTTWITRGPTTWPVEMRKLPGIFGDGLRLVGRLMPEVRLECDLVERHLVEYHSVDDRAGLSTRP